MPPSAIQAQLRNHAPDTLWPLPPGYWHPVVQARKTLHDQLTAACFKVVEDVWRTELPRAELPHGRKLVQKGVNQAIKALIPQNFKDPHLALEWSVFGQACIAPYWEPAVLPEQGLTLTQQAAVRWAAAMVNQHVRNALEDLHAQYTGDDCMPELNRRIRNEVAAIVCADGWLRYHFAKLPAYALWGVQCGLLPASIVPLTAGEYGGIDVTAD